MDPNSSQDQVTTTTPNAPDDNSTISSIVDNSTDANAAPSTAGEERPSIYDAVSKGLELAKAENGETPLPESKQDDKADPEKEKPGDADRFDKHPRFQELRGQIQGLETEIASYKTDAESFRQLSDHLTESGISSEEFKTGMGIMTLMRNDPTKALELLIPHVQGLQQATGKVIPQDIAERYQRGLLDEESARQLSEARAQVALHEQRQAAAEQAAQAAQEAAEQQSRIDNARRFADSLKLAASSVEAHWLTTDPDYATVQPMVIDRTRALLLQERPQTPEAAAELVRRARREVDEWARKIQPAKLPMKVVTGGSSSTAAAPAPQTMLDAVSAGLARARQG